MDSEEEFIIADYYNLPKMDCFMVAQFFGSNRDFCSELQNMEKPPSEDCYGDDAIGYVQLKRDSDICTVKCNVCPYEPSKSYSVTINVNEKNGTVSNLQCHECMAACVHSVAFLLWLYRRHEEPDLKEKREHEHYFVKSFNALVGTKKFATVKEMFGGKERKISSSPTDTRILDEFVAMAKARGLTDSLIVRCHNYTPTEEEERSLQHLLLTYKEESVEEFIGKISPLFTKDILKKIEEKTREKDQCSLWHELKFARMTPLKAHEVMNCPDSDTALELQYMIAGAIPDAPSKKKRTRVLESQVFKTVEKALGKEIKKCGLFISKDYPMIAGSPDGVGDEFLIKIKCPKTRNSVKNYVKNGKPAKKFYAEIQLQMYVCGMKKGYFCIADCNFKDNDNVNIIVVDYDEAYVNSLLESLSSFWKANIYPVLFQSSQD